MCLTLAGTGIGLRAHLRITMRGLGETAFKSMILSVNLVFLFFLFSVFLFSLMGYEWQRFAVFKYGKGQSSVLVVKEDDYYKCNVGNPIEKYTNGYTVLRFGRSGPFYFIGGSASSCQQGQRLVVVVVAIRQGSPSPSPAVPAGSPPALVPPGETPEGSPSHDRHSPAPSPRGSASGARPVSLVLGIGFGVSMVLGNFFGL